MLFCELFIKISKGVLSFVVPTGLSFPVVSSSVADQLGGEECIFNMTAYKNLCC